MFQDAKTYADVSKEEQDVYTKEVNLLDIITVLENQGISIDYKDSLAVTCSKMKKILFDRVSAAMFTKKALSVSDQELTSKIQEFLGEANDIFMLSGYCMKINLVAKTVKIFDGDRLLMTYQDGKMELSAALSKEEVQDIKDSNPDVPIVDTPLLISEVIVLPPLEKTVTKPLQKSIVVDSTVVDETPKSTEIEINRGGEKFKVVDGKFISKDDKTKATEQQFIDAANARAAQIMAKTPKSAEIEINRDGEKFKVVDGKFISKANKSKATEQQFIDAANARAAQIMAKTARNASATIAKNKSVVEGVKVINNPETTITLENTQQIATRIDIDLLKKYINIDSLKNAPAELKAKIMARLEGAIKTVLKAGGFDKFLNLKNAKYGLSKSTFFDKDRYILFNGKHYMKFIDAENFEFDNKLN